jgi:DNA-binding MarR family transcriptional regulator
VTETILPPTRAENRELIERIVGQVEETLRHLRCAASDRLVREGVSMTQLRAIWLLEEHGELGMTGLADLLEVSLSNATGLVDRMEERGLVQRIRVTDDRRAVHVRPTPRGVELARTIEVLRGDLMETVLGRLDDRQLERVARTVEDIRTAVFAVPLVAGPVCPPGDERPADGEDPAGPPDASLSSPASPAPNPNGEEIRP